MSRVSSTASESSSSSSSSASVSHKRKADDDGSGGKGGSSHAAAPKPIDHDRKTKKQKATEAGCSAPYKCVDCKTSLCFRNVHEYSDPPCDVHLPYVSCVCDDDDVEKRCVGCFLAHVKVPQARGWERKHCCATCSDDSLMNEFRCGTIENYIDDPHYNFDDDVSDDSDGAREFGRKSSSSSSSTVASLKAKNGDDDKAHKGVVLPHGHIWLKNKDYIGVVNYRFHPSSYSEGFRKWAADAVRGTLHYDPQGDEANRDIGKLLVKRLIALNPAGDPLLCPYALYQRYHADADESRNSHQCSDTCNPDREQRLKAYQAEEKTRKAEEKKAKPFYEELRRKLDVNMATWALMEPFMWSGPGDAKARSFVWLGGYVHQKAWVLDLGLTDDKRKQRMYAVPESVLQLGDREMLRSIHGKCEDCANDDGDGDDDDDDDCTGLTKRESAWLEDIFVRWEPFLIVTNKPRSFPSGTEHFNLRMLVSEE